MLNQFNCINLLKPFRVSQTFSILVHNVSVSTDFMGFQNLIYSPSVISPTFLVTSVANPCQAGQVA
jgi:hypothetical protein